jgi:hypothetical protein
VLALGMSVGTAVASVAAASLWTVALLERQQTLQLGADLGAGVTSYPGGEFNQCSGVNNALSCPSVSFRLRRPRLHHSRSSARISVR